MTLVLRIIPFFSVFEVSLKSRVAKKETLRPCWRRQPGLSILLLGEGEEACLKLLGEAYPLATAALAILCVLVGVALSAAAALRYALVFPLQPHQLPTSPLTTSEEKLAERLRSDVEAIASVPHNVAHYEELENSAATIEAHLGALGYAVQRQFYTLSCGTRVRNIHVVLAPSEPQGVRLPTYVIGAHYDSPDDSPGANDNGTGVAALLKIARMLQSHQPKAHRLRLVFFVNEEAPYCKTPQMGSWQFASWLKDSGEEVRGMMALETLGYFSNEPGTQAFPFPFNYVYENRGNFVAFVGLPRARALTRRAVRSFRRHTGFPTIGGIAPGFIPGIDLSDHWSFNEFGFPALMVTDTAPFRNPYYHKPFDRPDTVDYAQLARITSGLAAMIKELAD